MRVVADEEELDQILMSDDNYGKLVVLDFFAEWCGPCKKLTPVLEELEAKAKGKVKFLKVDVDQSRELSGAHGVTSMPTLEFYRNGEKIATMVGANIVELKERVALVLRGVRVSLQQLRARLAELDDRQRLIFACGCVLMLTTLLSMCLICMRCGRRGLVGWFDARLRCLETCLTCGATRTAANKRPPRGVSQHV